MTDPLNSFTPSHVSSILTTLYSLGTDCKEQPSLPHSSKLYFACLGKKKKPNILYRELETFIREFKNGSQGRTAILRFKSSVM